MKKDSWDVPTIGVLEVFPKIFSSCIGPILLDRRCYGNKIFF